MHGFLLRDVWNAVVLVVYIALRDALPPRAARDGDSRMPSASSRISSSHGIDDHSRRNQHRQAASPTKFKLRPGPYPSFMPSHRGECTMCRQSHVDRPTSAPHPPVLHLGESGGSDHRERMAPYHGGTFRYNVLPRLRCAIVLKPAGLQVSELQLERSYQLHLQAWFGVSDPTNGRIDHIWNVYTTSC